MTDGEQIARAAWAALDAGLSGDPAAAARCLEPDVVFLGSGEGEEAVGIEAIGPMLAAIGPHAAGGTFDVAWDELDARIEGDLAFVTGFGTTRATGSMAKFDGTRYRLTGVLVRRDGDRRWRSFHGSEPSGWSPGSGHELRVALLLAGADAREVAAGENVAVGRNAP